MMASACTSALPTSAPEHDDWLRSVPNMAGLICVTTPTPTARVAYTSLGLTAQNHTQLSQLQLMRDYGRKSAFARKFKKAKSLSINTLMSTVAFNVSGWHLNPAHSGLAQERFKRLAAPLFPIAYGQAELLENLSQTFAQLASVMDRRELSFLFRAQGPNQGDTEMHCDPDSDYVGIAYVLGNTSPHANPLSYTPEQIIPEYNKQGVCINRLPLTDAIRATMAYPAPASYALWRGENTGDASPHMRQANTDPLRLLILNDFNAYNRAPAYRHTPTLIQQIDDWRRSQPI